MDCWKKKHETNLIKNKTNKKIRVNHIKLSVMTIGNDQPWDIEFQKRKNV